MKTNTKVVAISAKLPEAATTLHFKVAKQTPGTVVFAQIEADGSECFAPVIRTLYLAKHSPLAREERLTMTLAAG